MRKFGVKCWALSIVTAALFNLSGNFPFYKMEAEAASLPFVISVNQSHATDRNILLIQYTTIAFQVKDVSGPAGVAIPIDIELPLNVIPMSGADAQFTYLMFRDIPKGFKLSSGFTNCNSNVVPIANYKYVTITAPKNYEGSFTIRVFLYLGDNIPPIERTANITIGSHTSPPGVKKLSTNSINKNNRSRQQNNDYNKTIELKISHESEALSLAKGGKFIADGNIIYARLIFMDLTSKGSARGAFAMGQTYDPQFLKDIQVIGIQPDLKAAKEWYHKAALMGHEPAIKRLKTIEETER
ncbi:MAG: SEL1-like repeat protein [Alphaproteobacteria bacterium]